MKECRRNISKSKPLEPAVYRKGRITLRARVQKKKKERVRAGEMEKEEIVITNQTEGRLSVIAFLLRSCLCLRFSFRDVTLCR